VDVVLARHHLGPQPPDLRSEPRFAGYLRHHARSSSTASEKDVESNPEYQKLKSNYDRVNQQTAPRVKEINERLRNLSAQILAVQNVFTDRRAYVNSLTYDIETTESASSKQSKLKNLQEYEQESTPVEYPDGSKHSYTYPQLEETYNDLKNQRAELSAELVLLIKPVNDRKAVLDAFVTDSMVNLTPPQIRGLQDKTEAWDPKILQINVADANIVDRCESCHMGIREPVKLTVASMTPKGKKPDEYSHAFTSHPEPALLKLHDPEKYGCSPCHQGNGRATTSVEKAHGTYEHWLWPLFPRQNVEAGCQTCHAADMVLVSGDVGWTISEGKNLFRQRGCVGCHRYEGYDKEPEDLLSIAQQIKQMEQEKKENSKDAANLMKEADAAASNDEANHLNDRAVGLKVANSKLELRIVQLDRTQKSLLQDVKKVGPNLKDVRLKLNKNWIPVWLKKPTDFRPSTRMPNFRLNDQQVRAISAYLWQSGLTDPLPKQQPGNAAHGKELFETRGCLACHSVGEGAAMQGGNFAANLTRVGEKANYDYLVRWVHNARQRTRPYCLYEKKDIGPEDYAKKGLPFVFDLDHSKCPNDGHELQVQNMTVMPSLRLAPSDAQDIASYLITLKKKDPSSYPDAAFMDDAALKAEGKHWIQHFGLRRMPRNFRRRRRRTHWHRVDL
jgi:cytochrome c551/c552